MHPRGRRREKKAVYAVYERRLGSARQLQSNSRTQKEDILVLASQFTGLDPVVEHDPQHEAMGPDPQDVVPVVWGGKFGGLSRLERGHLR